MGDGGAGGDPHDHGQNRASLLGKLLRVDVDRADPYAVPRDNPFANTPGARGEIWALGLRNPWRIAFDASAGRIYIADVGQNAWEEVHGARAAEGGLNYGWRIMEGNHCYRPRDCDRSGLVEPIVEYPHSEGCSITGGFVYRGRRIPRLEGHYLYADYCRGWIRSFRWDGRSMTDHREWRVADIGAILSFGVDAEGEHYVMSESAVYRIVPA
jgi:glucose/arabinose dehydrogenase